MATTTMLKTDIPLIRRSQRCSWRLGMMTSALIAVAILQPAAGLQAQTAKENSDNPLAQLHWRSIGPMGNRAAAIAGVPGNPLINYLGAASGGVWKTENGGVDWKPVFDGQNVSAIGALAVAQSQPNVVWAGTGETFIIRPFYPMGDGIYKSTDSGASWQHMGLETAGHIGRVIIDPHDPQRVFACTLGEFFKPAQERGVYRTTDGGKSWQHVLAVDENTGCSDLAIDPEDPSTLVAGMWPLLVHPWILDSGGPGGGVYITHDGGATWHKAAGHGMPAADHAVGKVAVAIAQSNPNRVYALVQDRQPCFYRSDDRGETWTLVSHDHMMVQRDSYYLRFGVSTTDPDRLYFLSPNYVISLDGGKSFVRPNTDGFSTAGGDNHDIWIDPTNSNRVMVANDAGASISLDGSRSFEHIRLPIAQVYHVSTDDQIPYNIYGNIQDSSSFRAPSNTLSSSEYGPSGIMAADFKQVGGCESGFATPDPANSNIVWSGCFQGVVSRMDMRDGQERDVSAWPDVYDGWAPKDVRYRWHWTIPLAICPSDPKRIYIGSQFVHATTDGGNTWKIISPDLTLNEKKYQGDSGGITRDNLYTYDASVIYSIAESPVKQGVIWAGTNDGQVSLTQDGGGHWTRLTKNIPELAPMGTIWSIAPSPFEAGTAYITVNLQQMADYNAYVYKTSDYGQSWKLISGGIPKSVNSSAHCVLEDPVRKGMLYLGTDNAIYVSWDDGGHWRSINNDLPAAPVYWLSFQKRFNDLVIATYGRGDYVLDDVTALRDFDRTESAKAPNLFTPRPAYRFRNVSSRPLQEPGARIIGKNPPYGADINFYLPAHDPHASVAIVGTEGQTIRTIKVDGKAGINRIWWDLRGENGKMPHMLVAPPGEQWVENGPEGYHTLSGIMIPRVVRGPLVVPGKYTVHLTTDGQTLTAPLTVLADPHSLGTPASIKIEEEFSAQLLTEINHVSNAIEHLEWVRKQIESFEMRYKDDATAQPFLDESKTLAERAMAIEGKLIDIHLTNGHEDLNRNPSQLYQKLTALYDKDEADQGPTSQELEVNRFYEQWLESSDTALRVFENKDVASFNDLLKSHHVALAIQP